ncbi:type III effector [Photorhabdus luminescens]|uniref:Type III effector n=1 Tax=Photorhabdus luminescens subsp. sonorensis TaxID=1173677 RepID=A0A5C4RFJ9_PHOLU|nr:type III effector [Photorhabdus luminescens]TNH42736.1 type III effector [Photorhabdus luminescens subsp. sonorensis]
MPDFSIHRANTRIDIHQTELHQPTATDKTCHCCEPLLNNTIDNPLTAPTSTITRWNEKSVVTNKQIEANISRLASESTAAHKTVDSLLSNLVKLFVRAEGNELTAITKMLNAYTGDKPGFSIVGQLGAGGFTRIISEARQNGARPDRAGTEPLTLREKATAYYDLTNSAYFRDTLEKIYSSPELKSEFKDIIDIGYLESKKFEKARGSTEEKPLPDQLALYTFKNENKFNASENPELYQVTKQEKGQEVISNPALAGNSLTKVQNDFRAQAPGKDNVWSTAASLEANDRLTSRELAFASLNPRNRLDRTDYQFGRSEPVKAHQELAKENIIVQRGNGFAVWNVKENTGFSKDAALHNLPTVAAPSGTTDRFITAARLLGAGLKNDLALGTPTNGESTDQSIQRGEREMKELTRWLATGYLVDDNHHSMIEVNLGAANHGLAPQWGLNLYTEPFSSPIHAKGFSVSSQEILAELEVRDDVHTDYSTFRKDLYGGSRATVNADGSIKTSSR